MDKNKVNLLRQYVSVALQSTKTYVDMGGDACGLSVLRALFKWPDVVYDLLNMIDNQDKSEEAFIQDVSDIMLDPIRALGLAYLDAVTTIPPKEKEAYGVILRSKTTNNMVDIMRHKDLMINVLTKLVTLKEKHNENRNGKHIKESRV